MLVNIILVFGLDIIFKYVLIDKVWSDNQINNHDIDQWSRYWSV